MSHVISVVNSKTLVRTNPDHPGDNPELITATPTIKTKKEDM